MTNCNLPRCAAGTGCALLLLLLSLAGCSGYEQETTIRAAQEPAQGSECGDTPTGMPLKSAHFQPEEDEALDSILLPDIVVVPTTQGQGRSSNECYQLQQPNSQGKKKKQCRCEPQSLPYARCRSEINSCRTGWNNSPLTWFSCEKKRGKTSLIPGADTVLILGANKRNHMPTGHAAYVVKVVTAKAPRYQLIISHTNYDRRCSLEAEIKADYNSATRTLNILNGAWQGWGKGLPVAGFILR